MTLLNATTSYAARGVNPERLNAILEHAGNSVLDVGCGNGAYVLRLAEDYKIFGVDFQQFESWAAMPHLFSVSDASRLNQEDSSVDTILSFETLEHLQDPQIALREYYRVCRKNIVLTVPNCDVTPGMQQSNMIYYHWIDRTHINFFNMESIIQVVRNSGFKVVDNYYINQANLLPLFIEAFSFPSVFTKLAQKLLLKTSKSKHYITCLVIGEKQV